MLDRSKVEDRRRWYSLSNARTSEAPCRVVCSGRKDLLLLNGAHEARVGERKVDVKELIRRKGG